MQHNNRIYYLRKIENQEKYSYEIGTVDPDTLDTNPLLTLQEETVGEVGSQFAVSPGGSPIILLSEIDDQYQIILVAEQRVEKIIPLQLYNWKVWDFDDYLELSLGGNTVYLLVYLRDEKNNSIRETGICAVPLDGGKTHCKGFLQSSTESIDGWLSMSLSPAGTELAVLATWNNSLPEQYRGVYLIDLQNPDWPVTKIPVPQPAANSLPVREQP